MRILLTAIAMILPLFTGSIYQHRSVSFTYLAGTLSMWALFQVLAVPAIYLHVSFTVLFWVYTGLVAVLSAIGIKARAKIRFKKPEVSVYLILAVCIIVYQATVYVFGMHLDEDDARWIAEANDALVKDRMLLHNPATGEYLGKFVGEMVKDSFSPWPFFIAWLSRFTGIHPAIMSHTVYPPVLLCLSYCAYYHTGRQLFHHKTEQGMFLLMVALIHMFMGINGYTQSGFTLQRIWQGKASVAAISIPAILMQVLIIQNEDTNRNWFLLAVAGCASCLMSGMGTVIGFLMIAVYGGYIILCKRWKRIPLWLASLAPTVVFGAGYYLVK